ncbi:glutathione S-transferase T2-like [Tripterygium wilfordii]|uniref:glutathione S-transferase T2-like n=1 Tax=Tripterygium wilfordii TaxID=458696 RepID=UPI0018F8473B|nr:glutathione S-transferase T2-like [Tripterygium wilfordii]
MYDKKSIILGDLRDVVLCDLTVPRSRNFWIEYESYSTKKEKQIPQRTLNRGGNFSIEEEKNLVSAWLNISIDAVQGTDQKAKTFGSIIATTYNATRCLNHNVHTERSLNKLWSSIQVVVNKFCGFLTQVEAFRPSETIKIDKLAKKMYHEMTKTHFQFDHCWNLLRHQPKWNMHMRQASFGQASSKRKHVGTNPKQTQDPINLDDDNILGSISIDMERPTGRKAEKERRKKVKADHKNLTDVIGQLIIDKKKKHEDRMTLAKIERLRVEKE